MTIETIGQQKNQKQKSKVPVIIASSLIGGAATATATFLLSNENLNAEKILALPNDKFQKIFSRIPVDKEEQLHEIVFAKTRHANNLETAEEAAGSLMGDYSKELSKNSFISQITSKKQNSIEDYKKCIEGLKTHIDKTTEAYNKAIGEIYKQSKTTNNKEIIKAQKTQNELFKYLGKISVREDILSALESIKEDKVTKESLKAQLLNRFNTQDKEIVQEALKGMGTETLKVKSLPKAAVFGAVATVVIGGLSALLTGPKKAEKPAEPKA